MLINLVTGFKKSRAQITGFKKSRAQITGFKKSRAQITGFKKSRAQISIQFFCMEFIIFFIVARS